MVPASGEEAGDVWDLNSWPSMKALKLAVRSLVMDSMLAGVVSLMLAAFVALASASSLPAMPAWPAIQWIVTGFECLM